MSRKEVHWLNITILVPGFWWDAFRILSRASTLLLVVSISMSASADSPSSVAGLTRLSSSRGSALHKGHLCWVSMTRSMHAEQKTWQQAVIAGLRRSSRQTEHSSRESILNCSISCNYWRFWGVSSTTFSVSRADSRELMRSPQSFQWLHICRSRSKISNRFR